jgi:hypothetical protein
MYFKSEKFNCSKMQDNYDSLLCHKALNYVKNHKFQFL